jgi:hypothetical protein
VAIFGEKGRNLGEVDVCVDCERGRDDEVWEKVVCFKRLALIGRFGRHSNFSIVRPHSNFSIVRPHEEKMRITAVPSILHLFVML